MIAPGTPAIMAATASVTGMSGTSKMNQDAGRATDEQDREHGAAEKPGRLTHRDRDHLSDQDHGEEAGAE